MLGLDASVKPTGMNGKPQPAHLGQGCEDRGTALDFGGDLDVDVEFRTYLGRGEKWI